MENLTSLIKDIIHCQQCQRLRMHCAKVAKTKRLAFRSESYWGKPVPGFGVSKPLLWIVGLAPGAHGANRTGRVFTGDSSGDWLYSALFRHGFSSQSHSLSSKDGLKLFHTYISCVCRCAPPQNRPTPTEIRACHPFLVREWNLLGHPPLILTLGKIAFDQTVALLMEYYDLKKNKDWVFRHLASYQIGDTQILASYHPSRQNTATKRLTLSMWNGVFKQAAQFLKNHPSSKN